MQNRLARQIVHFHMTIDSSPPGRLPSMTELSHFLLERVEGNLATKLIESERFEIAITRGRILRKPSGGPALALLFTFADPDAADPANIHLRTRAIRRFDKLDGEARGFSAHAVLDLEPRHQQGRTFTVLLESAERLGKTRVRQMLDYQFRLIFRDKEITVENEQGQDQPAKPRIGLDTVASDRLRAGARGGQLKMVKLIDAAAVERGFDPPEGVRVRRREMYLKVDVPAGEAIDRTLNRIRNWARGAGFEEMYVEWVRPAPDRGADQPMSAQPADRAKINLAQEDIGEALFARKEFVDLRLPLPDLCTELSDELIAAMVAMLG